MNQVKRFFSVLTFLLTNLFRRTKWETCDVQTLAVGSHWENESTGEARSSLLLDRWDNLHICYLLHTNIVYIKGSPALPASEEGFQPMPSVTIRPADDSHLPSANTCISRLYIPLYSRLIKLMIILYIDKLLFSANKYWKPNCYSLSKLKILDLCESQSTIVKVERAVKVFYLYLNLNLWTIMWILLKQIFLLNWHFKYYYFFSFVLILYTKINYNLNESLNLFWDEYWINLTDKNQFSQ